MVDLETWRGINDFVMKTHDDLNDEATGGDIARIITRGLRNPEFGITLPPNSRYLAMGAGHARAELELARQLGVQESNITLLDKGFSYRALKRFASIEFKGKQVEQDMFSYLEIPRTEKFDLVTSIGMEFAHETNEDLERLVAGLAGNLNENGVAVLFPAERRTRTAEIWNKHGFVSLFGDIQTNPYTNIMLLKPLTDRGQE